MASKLVMNKSPSSSSASQENIRTVRAVIKLLLIVVYLGTLMIWILMPTNTYWKIWYPHLRAEFNSTTYFGVQGTMLLIFMLPIFFVAVMGCVYLHLGNKLNDDKLESKHHLAKWRKPMLVKGPLGIVSGIELAFFIMLIALLIWSLTNDLHNRFATITKQSAAKEGDKVWQAKLESTALWLGVVGNICLTLLFFPVTRGSSVLTLFGLTSEASIKYHIWIGHMGMTLFTAHGVCYIIYWAITSNISENPVHLLIGNKAWSTFIQKEKSMVDFMGTTTD